MKFPLSYFVYSATVLGCISASIGKSQTEICDSAHRESSELRYGCGSCKSGYIENSHGGCVLNCPDDTVCRHDRRLPCTEHTGGQCGDCLTDYLDIEGICATDTEVDEVIKRIEVLLDAKSQDGQEIVAPTSQPTTEAKSTTASTPAAETTASTTAPKTPTTKAKESEVIPPVSTLKTEDTDPDETKVIPSGDKRAPLAAPVSQTDTETDGDHINIINARGEKGFSQLFFFVVVLSVSLLCLVSVVIAGVCWYRLNKQRKLMETSDYVGYGSSEGYQKKGSVPPRSESGDRKLAHSAQMYHYQHHKQQMMALEKSQSDKVDESDQDDLEENEDGNYTVYECPGLAPAGEMEVSNPLFQANSNKGVVSPGSISPLSSHHSQDEPNHSPTSTSDD